MTQSNTIYVSNAGNDVTGNGSLVTPYATLSKVSSILQNSTKILLERGSVFNVDKLDLTNKNNIALDVYGDNPLKVYLTGTKTVTGWTNEGGNIWSKTDPTFPSEITNIYKSNTRLLCGRTPVATWKTATGGSATTLVDTTLTDPDGYWTGCEIVALLAVWEVHIARVSDYSLKTFTYPEHSPTLGLGYTAAAGTKYFIQNHVNCLTQQDTWAYDMVSKKLYIYSVTEPTNITCTYGDDSIYCLNAKFIDIKNISISNSQRCGVYLENTHNVSINTVEFSGVGMYGIYAKQCNRFSLKSCSALNTNSSFLHEEYCNNLTIEDNNIQYSGLDFGSTRYIYTALNCGQSGCGLALCQGNNMNIRYNTIGYSHYMGVMLDSQKFLIQYNYIHNFNLLKEDGGGIYIATGYTSYQAKARSCRVLNNIILTGNTGIQTANIYIEELTYGIEVAYNFCYAAMGGIFTHKAQNNYVHHNTIYTDNYQLYAIWFDQSNSAGVAIRNIWEDNLIVCAYTGSASFYVQTTTVVTPNTVRNNKYYYPFGKAGTGTDNTMFKISTTWYTLAGWVADESRMVFDRTGETEITPSLYAGSAKPKLNFLIYLTNPNKTNRVVTAAELPYSDYLDMDGNVMSYPFTIEPYGSKVLVRPN